VKNAGAFIEMIHSEESLRKWVNAREAGSSRMLAQQVQPELLRPARYQAA
jgi:hypothetical protein